MVEDLDQELSPEIQAKLDAAKAAHGEAFVLQSDDQRATVIVRRPKRGEYQRYQSERFNDAKKTRALERLFLSCLVWPLPAEFDAVLEQMPALGDTFGLGVCEIAGGGGYTVKKA
jgi:hypothetical protein